MTALSLLVTAAEIATAAVFAVYLAGLVSMHREAATMRPPRLDPVSRSLLTAAKFGLLLGVLALALGSVFFGGLT